MKNIVTIVVVSEILLWQPNTEIYGDNEYLFLRSNLIRLILEALALLYLRLHYRNRLPNFILYTLKSM